MGWVREGLGHVSSGGGAEMLLLTAEQTEREARGSGNVAKQ